MILSAPPQLHPKSLIRQRFVKSRSDPRRFRSGNTPCRATRSMRRDQRDEWSPAWQCGDLTVIAQRILAVCCSGLRRDYRTKKQIQRRCVATRRKVRSPHCHAGLRTLGWLLVTECNSNQIPLSGFAARGLLNCPPSCVGNLSLSPHSTSKNARKAKLGSGAQSPKPSSPDYSSLRRMLLNSPLHLFSAGRVSCGMPPLRHRRVQSPCLMALEQGCRSQPRYPQTSSGCRSNWPIAARRCCRIHHSS
jgi:hypothetical protein